MSDSFLADLPERKYLEASVFRDQVLIIFDFMWRIVDEADDLVALREYWSVLRYLLPLRYRDLRA